MNENKEYPDISEGALPKVNVPLHVRMQRKPDPGPGPESGAALQAAEKRERDLTFTVTLIALVLAVNLSLAFIFGGFLPDAETGEEAKESVSIASTPTPEKPDVREIISVSPDKLAETVVSAGGDEEKAEKEKDGEDKKKSSSSVTYISPKEKRLLLQELTEP